jgi:hypothetical protein
MNLYDLYKLQTKWVKPLAAQHIFRPKANYEVKPNQLRDGNRKINDFNFKTQQKKCLIVTNKLG